jgi:glutaredoxin 3
MKVKKMRKRQVEKLISSHGVLVYSKTYCPFSSETKELLNQNGVEFKVIELDTKSNGKEI